MICYTDNSLSLVSTHSRGPVTSVLPPPKKNTSYRRLFSLHCEQALVTKFRLKPQPRIMQPLMAAAHGTFTETPTGNSHWKCVHKNLFSLEGFNVVIKFSVKKKKRYDFTDESFDTLSRTCKKWFHSNSSSFLLFTIVKSLSHELNKELY